MTSKKLTVKTLENIKPPESGRLELWDSVIGDDHSLPGTLGLRVTPSGVMTWQIMYRVTLPDGQRTQRRLAIGKYPSLSLSAARTLAREELMRAGRNEDPKAVRASAREAASKVLWIEDAVDQFIERYAKPKNRGWRETRRVFDKYLLPYIGERRLDEIGRRDIVAILDGLLAQGHPYLANRVLATVRRFFNWCLERELLQASPTANIKPPGKEVARDRVLKDDEISILWNAFTDVGWPFGPAFKLLLVTGQRLREVTGMRWVDLDLEAGIWTQPRELTKTDRAHEVPLSPLAMRIIQDLPRTEGFVFTTNGRTPISGFSKAKARCDRLAQIDNWRLHDLRRTAASGMARLKVQPWVVEQVLNHQSGQISGVAGVYNRYGYLDEKREALDAWADELVKVTRNANRSVE